MACLHTGHSLLTEDHPRADASPFGAVLVLRGLDRALFICIVIACAGAYGR